MDKYALAFSVSNLGPKSFQRILNKFEDLNEAWGADKNAYEEIEIKEKTYEKFNSFRKSFDFNEYGKKLKKNQVSFIAFTDTDYPKNLKKLENPPIGLYVKGNRKLLTEEFFLAVVGTRKVTEYGRTVTEVLVKDLVQSGACIVSGLALGIDGIAHATAVKNGGVTIAVLACGVDCCLPSEHYGLYQNILKQNGLIISEYPLSQPPNKGTFLARNRIVAALSQGVLVTEAAFDSGSLVTADWGLKLGKKVFAVPGPINSQMVQGSLKLLKQGAKLVTTSSDILEEFKTKKLINKTTAQKFGNLNKEEKKIVALLENEEMTLDELATKTKLSVLKIMQIAGSMELRGVVKNSNGKLVLN